MKRSELIFLFLLVIYSSQLKAAVFSDKDKMIINTNAITVLENYQTILNMMGEYVVSDIDKAKSTEENFLELFVNRQVLIYNDLDPSHKLSEFYESETYANNIILWYPDGLSVRFDMENAKVSDIMTHEGNICSIDILVKRTLSGNYLNRASNNEVQDLIFRIAFVTGNKSFSRFRIAGVRNASSNYTINDSQILKEVNNEEFTSEDMANIRSELKTILNDYTNYLSLIGDPKENSEDKEIYKTSFIKLFKNVDVRVYNDINPELQASLISVNDYLLGFITDYPNGIKNLSINADSAKFGNVLKDVEGYSYTYVKADKFFSGSFRGKDVFRKMAPLTFKISFNASGKTFTDFAINSIDISSVDFYEAIPGKTNEQKPALILKPVTRKGYGLSFISSFRQTHINSKDIESLTVPENQHSWKVSALYGYLASLGFGYNFNDHIALRSGIELSKYSTRFNLNGNYTSGFLSYDINVDPYYKIVNAEFDSLVSVNYITIPLLINYTSGKPGKFGFYGEGGFKISIPVKSSFSSSGNYITSGYYPYHEAVTQYLYLPELGFVNRGNISETGNNTMTGLNISFYSYVGLNIPLGYYSSLTIGPEITLGLSDVLKNEQKYFDIFGKSYGHQPTKINSFGIRISFVYKL
jgi:Outer membrane protein beta-barrel domain